VNTARPCALQPLLSVSPEVEVQTSREQQPDTPRRAAALLANVVAAAGGIAGTFAGALEARHIEVDPQR